MGTVSDPAPAPPKILSVSELTRTIRSLLELRVGRVWVEGEISNYRKQGSGHQYFTLKDARSQLACILFRGDAAAMRGMALADGQQVQVYGEVTVYEARGQCQLIVQIIQPRGQGLLQARFEALKRKLQAEGLFEAHRKQPLPRFPATIGLVTSPTGAALQDMLHVLKRRAPWVRILIYPVRVQGAGAALEIAQGIAAFNDWTATPGSPAAVDLIVLARGGGSIEDLFEFNEEAVARAMVASALPIVSAIGHEVDFTIADFVADLRAPTPSAAAELIVPDGVELKRQLSGLRQALARQLSERVQQARLRLESFGRMALGREPARRLREARQRLDIAESALRRLAADAIARWQARVEEQRGALRPAALRLALQSRRELLQARRTQLGERKRQQLESLSARLRHAQGLLRVLGPQGTLDRGYSITTLEDGALLSSVSQAPPGSAIRTRLADGTFASVVAKSKPARAVKPRRA
jgi:exodeoxyribonuclease VII large subunit